VSAGLGCSSILWFAFAPAILPPVEDEVLSIADGVTPHPPVQDPETHRLLTSEPPPETDRPKPTIKEARQEALAERARLKAERSALKAEHKRLTARQLMLRKTTLERAIADTEAQLDRARARQPVDEAEVSSLAERLKYLRGTLGRTKGERREFAEVKRALRANRTAIQATKNFRIMPLVGPAYTPELGFSFAGGIQMSWTSDRRDPDLPRSSAPVSVAFSTTGAIVFSTRLTTFWLHDRLRWNTEIWLKDMPDNYWGVGYEAARGPSDPDETTAYDRTWWQIRPTLLGRVYRDLFVGGIFDFNQTVVSDPSPEMEADPDYIEYGADNYNGGVGAMIAWDSRDFPVNAYEGIYAAASFMVYGPHFGGDNLYEVLDLDYRHYITIRRPGSTLTWQIHSRSGFGDVPYAETSMLGSPFDLRAYRWGRYRDDSMLYALLEYRYMFARRHPSEDQSPLTRHGFVVWAGVGSVAPNITKMTHWLPNAGVGYRFEVQPRLNVRVDVGFGNDSYAFYFNFQEAF